MRNLLMPVGFTAALIFSGSCALAQQSLTDPLRGHHCHDLAGECANTLTMDINGEGSEVRAGISGRASTTTIHQYGDNGKLDVNHSGVGGELIVFGNHCPPGTRAKPITHHGSNGSTRIAVAQCH